MTGISAIRMVGDVVLHRSGKLFSILFKPHELDELYKQIAIAKNQLIISGGAGIAANQCAEIADPYCFTIVGVFHAVKEHYEHASRRYPTLTFPEAVILINPEITSRSEEQQIFPHGCLSVPSTARAEMRSPTWLTVRYYAIKDDNLVVKNLRFEGSAAVVLDHELKHILKGHAYVDVCIDDLSRADREKMHYMLHEHLTLRLQGKTDANTKSEFVVFIKAGDSGSYLDEDAFSQAIKTMSISVLHGIDQRLKIKLQDQIV